MSPLQILVVHAFYQLVLKLKYLCVSCSILIKVCVLLRNRFQEIRDVARGTLVKIIETLGCRYLQYLLKEMQSVLVKGYQV